MADEFERIQARLDTFERAIATLIDVQQHALDIANVDHQMAHELRAQLAEVKATLTAAVTPSTQPREVNVGRINVREPDGTLRMAITNQDRAPNGVINGKELLGREGGNSAGIYFYNNEGDECGALQYGSRELPEDVPPDILPKGTIVNGLGLTFDRYKQDQMVAFQHEDAGSFTNSRLIFSDCPTPPLDEWLERYRPVFEMPEGAEKRAAMAEMRATGHLGASRIYIGKTNGSASIGLSDDQSRPRIRLFTEADGRAGLEFLDEAGAVTHRWPNL